MKAQGKQYSEGAACFGQMTTGMSGPKFLICVPIQANWGKKKTIFPPFKSFPMKQKHGLKLMFHSSTTMQVKYEKLATKLLNMAARYLPALQLTA